MIPHPRERRPKPRHPIGTLVATHRGPGTVVQNTWSDMPAGWMVSVEVEGGESVTEWESRFKEIKP